MVCENKEDMKREYKRPREISPKCGKVVVYLSTHIIRTHKYLITKNIYKRIFTKNITKNIYYKEYLITKNIRP